MRIRKESLQDINNIQESLDYLKQEAEQANLHDVAFSIKNAIASIDSWMNKKTMNTSMSDQDQQMWKALDLLEKAVNMNLSDATLISNIISEIKVLELRKASTFSNI